MPRPALSSALTSCAVVSFVVKAQSQRRTPSYSNQYVFRRSDAASNRDFEPGFEGPSGVRSLDLHVLRVPPPVFPCYGELSPCYGEIISLLPSCSACTANFPQAIVIKMNFPAKTGPETANSPCFPPVIREYQGESGRQTPLQPGLDHAGSCRARFPSKLGWSPGDLRCVNAVARTGEGSRYPFLPAILAISRMILSVRASRSSSLSKSSATTMRMSGRTRARSPCAVTHFTSAVGLAKELPRKASVRPFGPASSFSTFALRQSALTRTSFMSSPTSAGGG